MAIRKKRKANLSEKLLDLPQAAITPEDKRKLIVLYTIVFLGMVLLLFMAVRLWMEGEIFFSLNNVAFMLFLMAYFLFIRFSGRLRLSSILGVIILQLFFVFLFLSGAGEQRAFVWYYLYPLIALFLLGARAGTFFSVEMITLTFLLNILARDFSWANPYSMGMMFRLFLSYTGVFIFALIFELTRNTTQSSLEKALAELNEIALHDSLTGLYNRRYLDEMLARIVFQMHRAGEPVAFFMADLDFFKKYNDTYGHQMGDRALISFAEMLSGLMRRETDLVFRYGGEEFAVLLAPTSPETVEKTAVSIVTGIYNLNIPHSDSPFNRVTVSLGAAFIGGKEKTDFRGLVAMADRMLYAAKTEGRNRYKIEFHPDPEATKK